jgi:hypothetical protein
VVRLSIPAAAIVPLFLVWIFIAAARGNGKSGK